MEAPIASVSPQEHEMVTFHVKHGPPDPRQAPARKQSPPIPRRNALQDRHRRKSLCSAALSADGIRVGAGTITNFALRLSQAEHGVQHLFRRLLPGPPPRPRTAG